MADRTLRTYDYTRSTFVDQRYIDMGDGTWAPLSLVSVDPGDINVGAVELKDATTSDRASVSPGGALKVDASDSVQPVSGPLTNAQLRASAVSVTGTFWQATQPVSATDLPLPAGASTSAKQDLLLTALADLLAELQAKTEPANTQTIAGTVTANAGTGTMAVSASALPLPAGAATASNQSTVITALGNVLTELQAKADLAETQPVSAASLPLPAGAATSANQTSTNTKLDDLVDAVNDLSLLTEILILEMQCETGALKKAIDEVSGSLTYMGFAETGTATSAAGWRVFRITTSGAVTLYEHEGGNSAFDSAWDNRASGVYS